MVQTSFSDESFDGDDASKGTLFPMYEQETLFSKETMQLEPGAVPSTDVVGDTGIFSHTVFDGEDIPDLSSPSSSSQEVAQAALDSADIEIADDDDDLQMIDLTNFGSDSEVSEVAAETTINVESDEERARAERRARRQAKRQAAAEEQEIDVFKTAFGKIAMMEASVEGPTTAESLQDKMVKETVENLLTAATVEGSLLTAATVVDESKLTVFEAKHLSIAEKIAAKKAAQLGAENNNYHSDQPDSSQAVVAKTEFGRNSRKVGEGPDVFGDDDYDAIGKLPNQNETPKTSDISNSPTAASAGANPAVNPKLTYFEMPPASDEEEQEAQGKAKKSEAKKQRRGLFGKRNAKVKKAKQKSDQSSDIFDTNLNTNLGDIDDGFNTTEQELSSDGLKITAERQQEFNKALSTSPIKVLGNFKQSTRIVFFQILLLSTYLF